MTDLRAASAILTSNFQFQIQLPNVTGYQTLEGITSFTDSQTAASTNEIRTFTNVITVAGRPGSNNISITAVLNPNTIPKGFTSALAAGSSVGIRYYALAEELSKRTATISIATTGQSIGQMSLTTDTDGVDQAFINSDSVLPGHLIVTGAAGSRTASNVFKVDRVDVPTTGTNRTVYVSRLDGTALSGTITSTGFTLARAGFTSSFNASITQSPTFAAELDGAVSVSFAFTSSASVPPVEFHATGVL